MNRILIILAFIINISFFISALWTGWYDYFFFGSSLHYCCKGMDFFQIPNGAYAFIAGGDLSGHLPYYIQSYSGDIFSNFNVYHPLLTLLLGSFFLLFQPESSFYLWIAIKFIINILFVYYLYENFKNNKYIYFAIFLYLANFNQYNEIRISQYQYLLNIFLLLLLVSFAKNKDSLFTGFCYFLTLLVKPIGVLWIPFLFIKKKYLTLSWGLIFSVLSLLPFFLLGVDNYYRQNLLSHFFNPVLVNSIDTMSLDALLRYSFHLPEKSLLLLKSLSIFAIFVLAFNKKVSIIKIIYLLILYFLFFYDLVYQYHFSVLAPLLAVCLLAEKDFQTKFSRIILLLITLPNIFFILRLTGFGVQFDHFLGLNPTRQGWQLVSSYQIFLLLILTIAVIKDDLITLVPGIKST